MRPDGTTLLLATLAADGIVLASWCVAAFLAVRFINGRVERALASPASPSEGVGDVALLLYGASLLFWPAALGIGMYHLGRPASARVGRNCLFIALGHFTLAVLAAIAIVTGLAIFAPSRL